MTDGPTPESVKRAKTGPNAPEPEVVPDVKGKGRPTVTVEDAEDEDEEEPGQSREEFAPGNDADYFAEEDQDGRFFGGGLTAEQKEILNIFDDTGEEGVVKDVRLHFHSPDLANV